MEKRQYEELRRQQDTYWWFRGKRDIVLDYAFGDDKPNEKLNVLDIGCGMGLMLRDLQKYGEVYGMDMEEEAVDYCRQTYYSSEDEDHIRQGSLPDDISFEDGFFDYIFALDVLEHVEDDVAGMRALHQRLKDGGHLVITVPAHMSLWSYNDELNHHFRRYEKDELTDRLVKAGFTIEKCSYYNFNLYPTVRLIRGFKNLFDMHSSDIQEEAHDSLVNRMLYRIFVSEKKWLRKHTYPTGVSLIAVVRK